MSERRGMCIEPIAYQREEREVVYGVRSVATLT